MRILLVSVFASCAGAPDASRSAVPGDFSLFVGLGREDGSEGRMELWLRPAAGEQRRWTLLLRRAPAGALPLRFVHVAERSMEEAEVARLYRALLRSRAFEIPTWLENAPVAGASPLTLRVEAHDAFRQCTAIGRLDDRLIRTLRSIDRWSPLRLAPWPDWLAGLFEKNDPRDEIPANAEEAVRAHVQWLRDEPERRALHLDLFALFVALGRLDLARFHLAKLPPGLQGLVPELEKQLR